MKFAERPEVVSIDVSGGFTDIIESICKFFCKVEKRVPIVDTRAGRRFAADFRSCTFRADASTTWLRSAIFVHFGDSRWGGVDKMKKSPSRSRGVAKNKNRTPMLHEKQNIKCFPCSMGSRKLIFAKPLERKRMLHQA